MLKGSNHDRGKKRNTAGVCWFGEGWYHRSKSKDLKAALVFATPKCLARFLERRQRAVRCRMCKGAA